MMKRGLLGAGVLIAAIVLYAAASLFIPSLLFFPYARRVDGRMIYSEERLPDSIGDVLARSDMLVRRSEFFDPEVLERPVFLTRGGWRWRLLSFDVSDSLAQTRPFGENIIVNDADVSRDRVTSTVGGRRLSDVIAHERTHVLIRMAFGPVADKKFPAWLREGYCDYVADSSTLSEAEAARLVAERRVSPALFYHQSRKRVEREIQANGGAARPLFRSFLSR